MQHRGQRQHWGKHTHTKQVRFHIKADPIKVQSALFRLQIRNYTDCACVQSRQVITPSSGGQVNQLQLVIVKTYLNENGYALSGKCDRTCNTLIPFLIFLFIVTLITACAQPSAIIVTLR